MARYELDGPVAAPRRRGATGLGMGATGAQVNSIALQFRTLQASAPSDVQDQLNGLLQQQSGNGHSISDVIGYSASNPGSQNQPDISSIIPKAQSIIAASPSAQAAAQAASVAAANKVITSARAKATRLTRAGNYDGARAALNDPNVTAAAQVAGVDLSADLDEIQNAQTLAQQSAQTAQNQKDNATILRAKTKAAASMGQGNFDDALAALQTQQVTDAATRIGYDLTGDIQTVVTAQANAKKAADAAAANTSAANAAAANATAAQKAQQDQAAALSGRVDDAIGKAQGLLVPGASGVVPDSAFRQALLLLRQALSTARRADSLDSTLARVDDVNSAIADVQSQQQNAQQQAQQNAASASVDSAINSANALAAGNSFAAALSVLSGASGAANASGRQGDIATAQANIAAQQSSYQAQQATQATPASTAAQTAAANQFQLQEDQLQFQEQQAQREADAQAAREQADRDAANAASQQQFVEAILPALIQPAAPAAPGQPTPAGINSQQAALSLLAAFGGDAGAKIANDLGSSVAGGSQVVNDASGYRWVEEAPSTGPES